MDKRNQMTTLESLPNEILLMIFRYINSIDLLLSFNGLNSRFNALLNNQYYPHCFIFDSISKHTFDTICQDHLPFMANRVISLHFGNNEHGYTKLSLFRSYIPSFISFTQLRSLTFESIVSYEMLRNIINECHQLSHLSFLKFIMCKLEDNDTDMQLVVDNIWSLPKLTLCTLDIRGEDFGFLNDEHFCMPKTVSLSMEYLEISMMFNFKANEINHLIKQTPHLKHLSVCPTFTNALTNVSII
ncbi:unnamed protein product [Adineta ricciae]|uniref:F-box domain-containing protein n=1 Tax=Adineta ricciae TaxID=249248 RepID=A0A816DRI1_ADIRI|nr:unnamed protein product [Adineta ricciae]CAF1637475.1 unnamed protein product [Adineta ricciae]